MFDQINEIPEDGLKSSPETLRYTENKWISRKNQNKLYFLHLIDILNYLLLIWRHLVVLNMGLMDWESSTLTTRPLLRKELDFHNC